MEFPDHYATLGVARTATQAQIKRAYRKLARRFHPDVSEEPDAQARFMAVAEAHEALIDAERRAAYDEEARHRAARASARPDGNGDDDRAVHARDHADILDALFGATGSTGRPRWRSAGAPRPPRDHHVQIDIDLLDACHGARRTMSLRMPAIDETGRATMRDRRLEVEIPKGVREGQRLRLAGQGEAGHAGAPPGDLYLEIHIQPHALYRLDGGDLSFDLPVAPWELALGASVTVPTPDGSVQLSVPAGSRPGQRLRLRGRGLPGRLPGDLYAVLSQAWPPSASPPQREAYRMFALAFPDYDPRAALQA